MKRTAYSVFILFFLFFVTPAVSVTAEISNSAPLPCSAPTGMDIVSVTSSTAVVSWDAVPGAIKYYIIRRVVGDTQWKLVSAFAPNTKWTLTNLAAGAEYEWKIRTICQAGHYKVSAYVSGPNFTTLSGCPGPDRLLTSNITSSSAKANWITTINSNQYRLRIRKVGTTPWSAYFVNGGTTSSFLFSGLEASTDYQWEIRSRCSSADDLSSWSAPELFRTHCGVPQNVLIDSVLSSSAIASWDTVAGAYEYRLRRRAVGDIDWVNSFTLAQENQHRFVGMLPGTEYEFQIQSFCDISLTDSSGYVSGPNFTTDANCFVPDGLSTTDVLDVSATANWTVTANSSQYRVRIREVGTIPWSINFIKGGSANSFGFTGLTPGTHYEWGIRSICHSINDFSAWSASLDFMTLDPRLSMPEAFKVQFEPINLYPNPSRGKMLIEMNTGCKCSEDAIVEITNTLGQNVYAGNIVTANGYIRSEVNLNENLANGMYFIRISQGNNSYNTHFLLSK